MEDSQAIQQPVSPGTLTCRLPECGKSFAPYYSMVARRIDTKYCCDDHRRQAQQLRLEKRATRLQQIINNPPMQTEKETAIPKLSVALPGNMDTGTKLALDMIIRDRDRWEKLYLDERGRRKDHQTKVQQLQQEILTLKHEHQMEKISSAKPTGLAGLAESPLMQHIGPALGKLAEKFVDGIASPQLGAAGAPDHAAQFSAWLATKQPETQAALWAMLLTLSREQDETVLQARIAQIEAQILPDLKL